MELYIRATLAAFDRHTSSASQGDAATITVSGWILRER